MLDFNDLFSKTKKLVGLDIGATSLKLAEVLTTSSGYVLNRFLQLPLPKGVITEGVINDPKTLSIKIKELFWNSGCRGKGVVASLSGNSVVIKKATFVQMEDAELRDLIRDEAGKYLPFDNMDDVNYDFQVLGDNEYNPNQMDVIIVAAKKDMVDSYVDAITSAGLTISIMDVDSFALETMYEANYEYEDNDIVVIVRIGADLSNINVIKGGMSIFTRDFTIGGNYITEGVQEKYGVTFEEAEQIKVQGFPESDQDDLDLRNTILDYAEPICSEIERSIDYFRSTFGSEYIKRIYLSGGTSRISGLAANLSQRLNVDTELINPLLKIGYNKRNINPKTIESIKPIAAVAIGLGLRKIGDK
ncbi:MAG TPA: type IV pilus assembly protein PilM [Deltaproteobacteria bacterium]|nr:type IV pilus assembly protein PilM [Deltaproteobacteria bacterium]